MIRKIIKPEKNIVNIDIPNEYIDKDIEILVFPIDKDREFISDNDVDFDTSKNINPLKEEGLLKTEDDLDGFIGLKKDDENMQEEVKFESNITENKFFEPDLGSVEDSKLDEFLSIDTPKDDEIISPTLDSEEEEEKISFEPQIEPEEFIQPEDTQKEIAEEIKEDVDDDFNPINNVLVAEDNDINQKLISKILSGFGLNVVIVSNGLMAVQKRKSEDFDMIFMDIAMPIMDGVEAIKNILKYEKESGEAHVPIVALTANALHGDREKFMSKGADEYVTKPVKKANISDILEMFSSKSNIEKIYKQKIISDEIIEDESSEEREEQDSELKFEVVDKERTLPHMDILVFRKNSMETFVAKSIIQQINSSCDSCENQDELCDKLKSTHYSLILFDYEIPDLDIVKLSQCVKEAEKTHQKGNINTIMLTGENSNIPAKTSSLFTEILKGMIGREKIIGIIDKYVDKSLRH